MLTPADHELLSDLLDDRLDGEQEAEAAARLEREPELRAAWDDLVRLRALVRDLPTPPPPADFVARVRARRQAARDSDGDADEREAAPLRALPRPERPHAAQASAASAAHGSAGPWPREALPGAPAPGVPGLGSEPIPLFWRRLMTVAYAAAALLVVGIGLMAVQDRKRDGREAASGREPLETAGLSREEPRGAGQRDASQLGGTHEQTLDKQKRPGLEDAEHEQKLARDADALAAELDDNRVPEAAGESRAPAGSGADGRARTGMAGPGGSVPPNLRAPSDLPPQGPGKAEPGDRKDAPRRARTPAPEPAQPSAPPGAAASAPILLVLEAASLAEGRALLSSTAAGPGLPERSAAPAEAAPARGMGGGGGGGAPSAERPALYQEVRLRLLTAADHATVARLPAADRARLPGVPVPPHGSAAAPLDSAGRAGGLSGGLVPASPAAPAAPLPTPAPAPAPSGAAALPPSAEPLGVVSLELSAQQLARLESLVGVGAFGAPTPASASTPPGLSGPAPTSEAAPRRSVRVLVVRAATR